MTKITNYMRIGTSKVLHLLTVFDTCHYVSRAAKSLGTTTIRRRDERVCDECQRLEKIERKK